MLSNYFLNLSFFAAVSQYIADLLYIRDISSGLQNRKFCKVEILIESQEFVCEQKFFLNFRKVVHYQQVISYYRRWSA